MRRRSRSSTLVRLAQMILFEWFVVCAWGIGDVQR
jgi:hypothetical protein